MVNSKFSTAIAWMARSVFLLGVMLPPILCAQPTPVITLDSARSICVTEMTSLGIDPRNVSITIYPHPITFDSMKSVGIAWMNFKAFARKSQRSLRGKTFWKCTCNPTDAMLDGIQEIYIDAKSGRVLYDYPAGRPRQRHSLQQLKD